VIFKTRVKLTRVVQTESGDYRVKGRLHSRDERCTRRHVDLRATPDSGIRRATDWKDHTTDRGKFSIRVPQSEEGTFRVRARGRVKGGDRGLPVVFSCKEDESRRFTLPPS
jgi:hypothetical protein